MLKIGVYIAVLAILFALILKIKALRKKLFKVFEFAGIVSFPTTQNHLTIEKISLNISDLPIELSDLKIVQLSDLHFDARVNKELIELVLNSTMLLNPDLIVLTGDYTNNNFSQFLYLLELLKILKAKYGVFAINGNNDENYKDKVKEEFKNINITLLENETVFPFGNDFPIIGLGEILELKTKQEIIQNVFDKYENLPKLVLMHNPEITHFLKNYRTDIILSGHTHGGSVRIPGFGSVYPIVKNICRNLPNFIIEKLPYSKYLGKKRRNPVYIEGIYKINEKMLNVSRGIGSHPRGIRIFCTPEINYITLKAS